VKSSLVPMIVSIYMVRFVTFEIIG
jgi:hypothetical protein